MLFDTLRRKNQAEQEEREWNANRPADYVSRNKDAMDSLTGQIGSGFDWDTGSKAYQQYRAQAQANAAASAENAQDNAAMLAGGYGSSYADSVAKQGQQQALSGIDNAVPSLRGQALSEYQNQQNDLLSALSGMANTEALDRSAYGSNFANYTAWQNFLANQSEQARNENDNYWNNLWNKMKNVGSAVMGAYDSYKGYTYQQELLEMQKQQQNQQSAELALKMYPYAPELALAIANDAGYDSSLFDNYSVDGPVTRAEKLSGVTSASGLAANGDDAGAGSVLKRLGLPVNSVSGYSTISANEMNQALQEYAAKQKIAAQYKTTGSGKSSGGSSGAFGGYTSSNVTTLLGKLAGVKEGSDAYNAIAGELAKAGVDVGGSTQSVGNTGTSGGLIAPLANPNKWALPGGTTGGSTGKSATQSSDTGTLLAQRYAKRGYSAWAIANIMSQNGYSDKEISDALEKAGVE